VLLQLRQQRQVLGTRMFLQQGVQSVPHHTPGSRLGRGVMNAGNGVAVLEPGIVVSVDKHEIEMGFP
jgi:hypothetical protein